MNTASDTKIYQIPCSWEMYAHVNVEATSLEEAIERAESDDFPLPDHGGYIDGSWRIDYDIVEDLNSE